MGIVITTKKKNLQQKGGCLANLGWSDTLTCVAFTCATGNKPAIHSPALLISLSLLSYDILVTTHPLGFINSIRGTNSGTLVG